MAEGEGHVSEIAETVDGDSTGIAVRDTDGRFQRVEIPAGLTSLTFRNGVSAFDTAYRLKGSLPTLDEVHKVWPKITKKTYATLMTSPEFVKAMEYRGVKLDVDSGLSMEQQYALLKLTDLSDRRALGTKLKELGIPHSRYQNWLKEPLFAELLNKATKEAYRDYLPMVRQALVGKAMDGDMKAVELVLNITGEWNPQDQQLEDARTVVMAIVEAVVKHVRDPETRAQIFADIRATSATLTAIGQRSLEE